MVYGPYGDGGHGWVVQKQRRKDARHLDRSCIQVYLLIL